MFPEQIKSLIGKLVNNIDKKNNNDLIEEKEKLINKLDEKRDTSIFDILIKYLEFYQNDDSKNDNIKMLIDLFKDEFFNENLIEYLNTKKINTNDIILEKLCDISIEELKKHKKENEENYEVAINSIKDKYGITNYSSEDIKERFLRSDPFLNVDFKLNGRFGDYESLRGQNKDLFYNITTIFTDLEKNYTKAQESLDNKIDQINKTSTEIGVDIPTFKF